MAHHMALTALLKGGLITMLMGGLSAWATVGGDVKLTVLGYEPTDQKVYLLHTFEDGWGGYKLYYFDFKGKTPNKLIEAKSYYTDPTARGGTEDDTVFEEKLTKLQKRLRSLPKVAPSSVKLTITKQSKQTVPMPYDPEHLLTEYRYQYHITHGKYRSTPQTAITYTPSLVITQAYQVPKHDKIVVAVRYLDEPMETGYTTEQPVLLSR